MDSELKTRKCKRKTCRAEFVPVKDWQKFCSGRCRTAEAYQRKAKLIRDAQKIIDAQAVGQ